MPAELVIQPLESVCPGGLCLQAPASKSLALRAILAAALAGGGDVELQGALAEDVSQLVDGLERLGTPLERGPDGIHIRGRPDTQSRAPLTLQAGAGGAPARFLLALAARLRRPVTVDGTDRLRERPMQPLLEALATLGAQVQGGPHLPATVCGPLRQGGRLQLDLQESSQHGSALLLALAGAGLDLVLVPQGPVVSAPYLKLTRELLVLFGLPRRPGLELRATDQLHPARVQVERDWSAGTVLLAAAAFLAGPVRVPGLGLDSLQPDRAFLGVLSGLGISVMESRGGLEAWGSVRRGGRFDLGDHPDAVPALAALGSLAPDPVIITGVPHLRHKECDRIAALVDLLRASGARAEARQDGLVVQSGSPREVRTEPFLARTRGDHRMAMAAALLGLRQAVRIDQPGCVAKSFPGFFEQWPGVVQA